MDEEKDLNEKDPVSISLTFDCTIKYIEQNL